MKFWERKTYRCWDGVANWPIIDFGTRTISLSQNVAKQYPGTNRPSQSRQSQEEDPSPRKALERQIESMELRLFDNSGQIVPPPYLG